MAAPCVLIASCTELYPPTNLIKEILQVDDLPTGRTLLEQIESYVWHVDTKYYTAEVELCTTQVRTIGDEQFAQSVEAFLVYFDSEQEGGFDPVKSWLPFVTEIDPEVRMVVCQQCQLDSAVPRNVVQKWCIEHGFELVELSPVEEDENDDQEDDFLDSYGVQRVVQALHAHTWPNLVMKEHPSIRSPYFQQLMDEQAVELASELQAASRQAVLPDADTPSGQAVPVNSNIPSEQAVPVNSDTLAVNVDTADNSVSSVKINDLDHNTAVHQPSTIDVGRLLDDNLGTLEAIAGDGSDGESFEKLFGNLQLMKERANNLPQEERRSYAEKVAMSFWRAMGGDEDELGSLSDCSSDG